MSLSQITDGGDDRVGRIELKPSHFATGVTLVLSTHQPDVRILDLRPQGCGADPINTPNIQDPTDFSATIRLYGFRTSQKFCIPYRLSDRAELLNVAVTPMNSNIEVLRDQRVHEYQEIVCFSGGGLCLLSLVFFSY